MATAVLAGIDAWFEREIFSPLAEDTDPDAAIGGMFDRVTSDFRSGSRVCLVGAFALSDTRDRFGAALNRYFGSWIAAPALALKRAGFGAGRGGRRILQRTWWPGFRGRSS